MFKMLQKSGVILVVGVIFSILSCLSSSVGVAGVLADQLANMSPVDQWEKFEELGKKMLTDPGPMPGSCKVKVRAGIYLVQGFQLTDLTQWLCYAFLWEGQTYKKDKDAMGEWREKNSPNFNLTFAGIETVGLLAEDLDDLRAMDIK